MLYQQSPELVFYVAGADPYREDHDGALGGRVEAVDLTTLQREADILSLHCNLTPETRGLVDREFLSGFSKPIVLINTARGPVIRTADLLDALATRAGSDELKDLAALLNDATRPLRARGASTDLAHDGADRSPKAAA